MSLCKYILQSEAVYIPAVSEGILAVLGHARVLVRSLPLAHNSEHSPSIIVVKYVTKSRKGYTNSQVDTPFLLPLQNALGTRL